MIIDVEEPERYPDEVDRACDLARINSEEGVKKVLNGIEKPPADFDGVHCVECGEPIPRARLKTGAFRDIDCQCAIEANRKQHRSHYE